MIFWNFAFPIGTGSETFCFAIHVVRHLLHFTGLDLYGTKIQIEQKKLVKLVNRLFLDEEFGRYTMND